MCITLDKRSYPLGTEFDVIQNQTEVEQEITEEQNNTNHKGIGHEPPDLAIMMRITTMMRIMTVNRGPCRYHIH